MILCKCGAMPDLVHCPNCGDITQYFLQQVANLSQDHDKIIKTSTKDAQHILNVTQPISKPSIQGGLLVDIIKSKLIFNCHISTDKIKVMKNGEKGGDFFVYLDDNLKNPSILVEAKNTETFDNGWIDKAIIDQHEQKCSAVIIVSKTLPSNFSTLGWEVRKDVHITNIQIAPIIITLLRNNLSQIIQTTSFNGNKNERAEKLLNYHLSDSYKIIIKSLIDHQLSAYNDMIKSKTLLTKAIDSLTQSQTSLNEMKESEDIFISDQNLVEAN